MWDGEAGETPTADSSLQGTGVKGGASWEGQVKGYGLSEKAFFLLEEVSDVFKCWWEGAIREGEAAYAREETPKRPGVGGPDRRECSTEGGRSGGGKPPPWGGGAQGSRGRAGGAEGGKERGARPLCLSPAPPRPRGGAGGVEVQGETLKRPLWRRGAPAGEGGHPGAAHTGDLDFTTASGCRGSDAEEAGESPGRPSSLPKCCGTQEVLRSAGSFKSLLFTVLVHHLHLGTFYSERSVELTFFPVFCLTPFPRTRLSSSKGADTAVG